MAISFSAIKKRIDEELKRRQTPKVGVKDVAREIPGVLKKIGAKVKDVVATGVSNVMYRPPVSGQDTKETGITLENKKNAFKYGPVGSFGFETSLTNATLAKKPSQIVDVAGIKSVSPLKKGVEETIKSGLVSKLAKTAEKAEDLKVPILRKTGQALKDVSSSYNVDRLNIADKAKEVIKNEIQNASSQARKAIGTKLTNKETIALAEETSRTLNKVVTRAQTEQKLAAGLKLRQQIAKAAESGKIDSKFVDMWLKDKAAATDIARQLQARKIVADPKEARMIDTVLEGIYKEIGYSDEIGKAAQGVNFNDSKQVTEFYRKFVKPKASEWVDLLRYNSMLSSPNTHIINIASNFEGTGVITPIEKTVTGMLDATRAALTGKPRNYAVGEGVAYAKGYYSNVANASKRFIDVIRGKAFSQNPDLRNIPLTTKGVSKGIENVLGFPLRLLEGADQFFSALTEGGVESSLKYRAAKGISGTDDVAKEAAKRLFRGELKGAEQGHVLNAIDSVTNLIEQARHSENKIVSTIAKFTLPFVRTPTNILKQGIEYSPLGLTTLIGASNKTEQLSKSIIGMASAAGAATLLGQDRLTWAEPTGADQKAAFRAAGRQAYSIKIGNKWVSYSKLHPAVAFNLALVASIDYALEQRHLDDSQADSILSAFAKYGNFLTDQSYLRNIGDFVAATKGDVGGYTKLISNYPQQLIPGRALLSWVERLTDPVQRQADPDGSILDRQMQQIMSQIPGLAQKVPARVSKFGQPIENQNRVLNAVSPNRVTTTNPSYESLYQLDESNRKLNRVKQDIKKMIEQEIKKRSLIK